MTGQRFKVGIVGLQPSRSWASRAHIPALRALSDTYEIAGVANTSLASAEKAVAEAGLSSRPFANVAEMLASPNIDIVSITVKVPHHLELAKAAFEAGKHVYCEWPLGNGLAEAEELAALAQAKGLLGVVGTQAPFAPEIEYTKELITAGFVGELLSTSVVARGRGWGGFIQSAEEKRLTAYVLDRANGATMLTIPLGHTLAAIRSLFGGVAEVSALMATRRPATLVIETGERLPMSVADQVLINGVLPGGAPISIHYRGGIARDGDGLFWEINGTEGDLRVSGFSGHTQMVQLSLKGAKEGEHAFRPLEVPASYRSGWPENPEPGNVARVYAKMARDLRDGTRTAPSFDDGVAIHRIIDAIEKAAESGRRTVVA